MPREITVDGRNSSTLPPDPDVHVPANVRRRAELAGQLHAQAYATAAGTGTTGSAAPTGATGPGPSQGVTGAPGPTATPGPSGSVTAAVNQGSDNAGNENWEHRYHSMHGQFNAAKRTIGSMQEQMQQLADEVMRSNQLLRQQAGPQAIPAQSQQRPTVRRVTDQDIESYGKDLVDLVTRAAQDALQPTIESLAQQTQRVRQETKEQKLASAYGALDEGMPEWRTINADPAFHAWLRLPDIYSGRLRQTLLSEARDAGNAPRMLAFFKGFVQDGLATGSIEQPPGSQETKPASRQAAVNLDTLAAPGKAKPSPGDQNPADKTAAKPIFTRAQIAKFYDDSRKGLYDGRRADYDRLQADIFAAQLDGRVR